MKKLLTKEELEDLAEGLVVANTAPSLLSWLEKRPSVQRLSTEHNADEVVDFFIAQQRQDRHTELDLAGAYAAFVALILITKRDGRLDRFPIDPGVIHWG